MSQTLCYLFFPSKTSCDFLEIEDGGLYICYTRSKRGCSQAAKSLKFSSSLTGAWLITHVNFCVFTHVRVSWTRPRVHPDPDFWGCCQRKGGGYWMISSHPAFCLSSVQSHSTEKRGNVIVSWDWRSKKTFTVLLLDAHRYKHSLSHIR